MRYKIIIFLAAISISLLACVMYGDMVPTYTPQPPTPTPTLTPTPTPTPTPSPVDIMETGWEAFDAGDLETAEQIANQVIEFQEGKPGAMALLGMIKLKRGQYEDALADLELAKALNYEDHEIYQVLADTYIYLIENNIRAIYDTFDYREILDLVEETQAHYAKLTRLPLEVQNIPQEIIDLVDREENVEYDANYSDELVRLFEEGMTLFDQGNYEEAVIKFEQCVESEPDYILAQIFLGRSYINLKQFESAIQHYSDIIEMDSDAYLAYLMLGRVYSEMWLPLHARDAYINLFFITETFEESSYDDLDYFQQYYSDFDHTTFDKYGFNFSYPSNFDLLGSDGDEESGMAVLQADSNDDMAIALIWDQVGGSTFSGATEPIELIGGLEGSTNMFGEVEVIGSPEVFPYNDLEIVIQRSLLSLDVGDYQGEMIGIYVGWKCDSMMVIFSFATGFDGNDAESAAEDAYLYLYPMLESISCGGLAEGDTTGFIDVWESKAD